MATTSSTGASAPGKSPYYSFPGDVSPPILAGLVQHALLPASAQVQILSIVDATGSASIGDIVAELPGHPDPVGAALALVAAGVLMAEMHGILDANTILRRSSNDPEPSPSGGSGSLPAAQGGLDTLTADTPARLERLPANPFSASVVVGAGAARRAFARMDALHRPGIYVLVNASSAYVGVGRNVGARIATGQQPIEAIQTIVAITDALGNLTADEARVAERMLWSRVTASRQRSVVNAVPDGAPVDAQRYSELEAFVADACLTLRHAGVLFTTGSARAVLAGPRAEPRRVLPLRPLDRPPAGDILELAFGGCLMALAARQADDRWLLLRGSDVRIETVSSANASTSFLRSAWLHAGILAAAPDGRSYVTQRDLVFASGSATAQFCTGSKGRGLADWQPVDRDSGPDPDIPALAVR